MRCEKCGENMYITMPTALGRMWQCIRCQYTVPEAQR